MSTQQPLNIPPQIETMINNLLNKKEDVFIRSNTRLTLDNIRVAIELALKKFDSEYNTQQNRPRSRQN